MQKETLSVSEWIGIMGALGAITNIVILTWQALSRSKFELKKLNAEGDSEFAEANLQTVEGAKISMELLKQTVDKLQTDIESEKDARKKDVEYFRRRIREMDKENREYRLWAAKLVKQVISAGLIPVAFEPIQESEPFIPTIQEPKEK